MIPMFLYFNQNYYALSISLYSNLSYLQKHIQRIHEEKRYQCKRCEETFSTTKELSSHKAAKHRDCQHCGQFFEGPYWKTALDGHIRAIHLGERKNICDTCGKAFYSKSDMRRHIGKKTSSYFDLFIITRHKVIPCIYENHLKMKILLAIRKIISVRK